MTTTTFDTPVQGVALYFEFRKPLQTTQVVVTPDGYTTVGNFASANFFRRTLSSTVTKRKWRTLKMYVPGHLKNDILRGNEITENAWAEFMRSRMGNLDQYFDSLARGGWKLVKDTPIYVEVSKADLDEIDKGNLPPKLWTRIKASRTALGFPVNLTDPMPSATILTSATTAPF